MAFPLYCWLVLIGVLLLQKPHDVAAESGCPFRVATSTFYLTSEIFDDTKELQLEKDDPPTGHRAAQHEMCVAPTRGCDEADPYRSFDGSCTNADFQNKPMVGAKHQCHRRILPSIYADEISQPPQLPDVVTIYNALQSISSSNSERQLVTTGLFLFLAQFFTHDIAQTTLAVLDDPSEKFDCCDTDYMDLPQCSMRIDVSQAIGYEDVGAECMSFIRASRCPCDDNKERQSMNQQTAHIDLSHVYGNGAQRDPSKPWRRASIGDTASGDLPTLDPKSPACYGEQCFKGDGRMNHHQGVSLYHIVFDRLHNQMADELNKTRPDNWSDDDVFQQARRLNIARYQYLILSSLTATLIDEKVLREAKLHIDQLLEGTDVDPETEAVTFAESIHAEFRLHGMVMQTINGEDLHWQNSSFYFDIDDFTKQNAMGLWRSGSNPPTYPFAEVLGSQLFMHPTKDKIGLSMLMINIQRGRDTGLASWLDMMKWANSSFDAESFDDVKGLFRPSDLEVLRKLYNDDLSQLDLYVGAHMQPRYEQGMVAYVMQKIHAHQVYGQVYGDRFFFTHKNVFSQEQREAIAKASSLSQILCETLGLDEVPEATMVYNENPKMLNCKDMQPLDYNLFVQE